MKHWFKDQHFRSLLKNSSYLAVSRIVAAIARHRDLVLRRRMALGAAAVRRAHPDHELRQGGQRHRASSSRGSLIVRYGGRGAPRRGRGFQDLHRLRLRARRGERGRRHARRRRAPAVHRALGRHHSRSAVARDALLHAACRRWAPPRPSGVLRALDRFDLISWQSTATPISRVILVVDRLCRRARRSRAYVAHLVRHRSRRRPLPMVPRLARASAARLAGRHPADASSRDAFPARGASRSTST